MRFMTRTILAALLALSWSGLASAGTESAGPSLDSAAFASMTSAQLNAAFEEFSTRQPLMVSGLSGPTTMQCSPPSNGIEYETCVVRGDGITAAMPAALAQN